MGGDKETIKAALEAYRLFLKDPIKDWEEPELLSRIPGIRSKLEKNFVLLSEEEIDLLKKADVKFLQNAQKIAEWAERDLYLKKWQKEAPLEEWYFHPDIIAEGKYPAELLPEWLREEYRKLHESGG